MKGLSYLKLSSCTVFVPLATNFVVPDVQTLYQPLWLLGIIQTFITQIHVLTNHVDKMIELQCFASAEIAIPDAQIAPWLSFLCCSM